MKIGAVIGIGILFLGVIIGALRASLLPLPDTLVPDYSHQSRIQYLDQYGTPLSHTYQNRWNYHDTVLLHQIPELLLHAFIRAEDKRFYEHSGSDAVALFHAVVQNVRAMRVVRGGSSISEQVVRLLHPRKRTLWSRIVEAIEAHELEQSFSKEAILEFYLNQVPYANGRRGVVQAARYYFDRSLDTLSISEMLALAVIVRAPSRLDLHQGGSKIGGKVTALGSQLLADGVINEHEFKTLEHASLELQKPALDIQSEHFLRFVENQLSTERRAMLVDRGRLLTTLDGTLQIQASKLLDGRLADLSSRTVRNGAVLIVENSSGQILAWVNGSHESGARERELDAVMAIRQPGSTLKPFLYGIALENGWNAATLIDDSPLQVGVGNGLHVFRNYSRTHYGKIRLREALGNSLNIPAVRTISYVGEENFLRRLRELGFSSLKRGVHFYGEGLALGNGEVSLFELVQAYSALARGGAFIPLTPFALEPRERASRVFSPEVSSLLSHVLSDPEARRLEFGSSMSFHFPMQVAVKTGTSSDYIDSWAIGYSTHYTVGVWIGNLTREPMHEVSGMAGPGMVLRTIFSELYRRQIESEPLFLSPKLVQARICRESGELASESCPDMSEWFIGDNIPHAHCTHHQPVDAKPEAPSFALRLKLPTPGLHLARDPRIPDELEAFPFEVESSHPAARTEWLVDEHMVGVTGRGVSQFPWALVHGPHTVRARVYYDEQLSPVETAAVNYYVK